MSLWTGIVGEANTRAAMAFNTVLTQKIVIGLAKHRVFFRMLFGGIPRSAGNQAQGSMPNGHLTFEKITYASGTKYEMQFLGRLDDFQFLADGNDEVALLGASVNTDDVAFFTWDLAHYYKREFITGSETKSIRGDRLKSEQLVDFKLRKIGEEYARFVNTRLFGNTNQARGSIAGLDYIISATNTYGATRSSAGNEFLQSYVAAFTGSAFNLDQLLLAQNNICANNGDAKCGFMGTTVFSYLQHELQEHGLVLMNPNGHSADGFGATQNAYARHGITDYYHDNDCGNKRVYMLSMGQSDLPYWKWVMDEDPLITTGAIRASERADAYMIPVVAWGGLFCAHPAAQGKMTAVDTTADIAAPSAWAA